MTLEERLAAARRAKPEMCSLNMGSMNFGRYPIAHRIKEFRFNWEAADLESSRDYIFRNTYQDIEYVLKEIGSYGTRFEFECYDVGHLYNLAHFAAANRSSRLIPSPPPVVILTMASVDCLIRGRKAANKWGD